MSEFRKALKAAEAVGSAATQGMGLFGAAMAAGRPGLGGVAPIVGVAGRQVVQNSRAVAPTGEPALVTAGQGVAQDDAGALARRQVGGTKTSYRAVVAQARHEAAGARARRETDAARLNLPVRGAALAGVSFAPPPGGGAGPAGKSFAPLQGGATEGGPLHPVMPGAFDAPVLRRRHSVHDAVLPAGSTWSEVGQPGDEQFPVAADAAPSPMVQADIERAIQNYFFRQSRLPPAGAAGFNPLLSPAWAGLKIPG